MKHYVIAALPIWILVSACGDPTLPELKEVEGPSSSSAGLLAGSSSSLDPSSLSSSVGYSSIGVSYGEITVGSSGGEITYGVGTIGDQEWMLENVADLSEAGSCYLDNESNCAVYGGLYTWEEASLICPIGWHLPDDDEWEKLFQVAGGVLLGQEMLTAGGRLKADTLWNDGGNGTDNLGFHVLPAGYQDGQDGLYNLEDYANLGDFAYFWSATPGNTTEEASSWYFGSTYSEVLKNQNLKVMRFSVRCIADGPI